MPPGAEGMIFLCGAVAEPLGPPTRDRRQLTARLQRAGGGGAGFAEARVAEGLQAWLSVQDRSWQAFLATDGGLDQGGSRIAEAFGGALHILSVEGDGRNIGITGFRPGQGKAQFHIWNGWPVTRPVQVRIERDGRYLAEARVSIPPGMSRHSVPVGAGFVAPGAYAARLVQDSDDLVMDDCAYLAVNPLEQARVLLVGPNNPFLRAALHRPDVELVEWPQFPPGFSGRGWDVVVADRVPIPQDLDCNILSFGRVPPGAPVSMGVELSGVMTGVDSAHPLLRFVDWQSVNVAGGHSLDGDPGGQPLATVGGRPVLVAWEKGGMRCAAWGTDLFASDLGLSGSFPIFLQNYLQWCLPQLGNASYLTLTVGVPAVLAKPPSWRVRTPQIKVERHGNLVEVCALTPGVFRWDQGKPQAYWPPIHRPANSRSRPSPCGSRKRASGPAPGLRPRACLWSDGAWRLFYAACAWSGSSGGADCASDGRCGTMWWTDPLWLLAAGAHDPADLVEPRS